MNTTVRIEDHRGEEVKRLLVLPHDLKAKTIGFLRRNNIQHSCIGFNIYSNYMEIKFYRIFKTAHQSYRTKIYKAYYHMS